MFLTKSFFLFLILIKYSLSDFHLNETESTINKHIYKKFEEFKLKFNKNYTTIEENTDKYQIFKENYLNMLHYRDANTNSSILGVTEFMDIPSSHFFGSFFRNPVFKSPLETESMPWNESNPQILNYQNEEGDDLYFESNSTLDNSSLRRLITIPSSYDWRSKGVVTSVKNQGYCGGCWAFSALVSVEGAYARKYKKLYSFSPQQIIDCNAYKYGCSGGTIAAALTYLKSNKAQSFSSYPFVQYKQTCKANANLGIAKVSSFYYSATSNEDSIAAMLYNAGPLAININATPLQFYKGGIFNPSSCSSSVNHGVAIVGYGTANGVPYWIVKNSWGENWGESGYFRIYRGKKLCGMTSTVIAAKVE